MTEMITPGQKKQLIRCCEDGIDAMAITKNFTQRVIEKGDLLQERLVALINELGILPYADEEVESNYGYPKNFRIRTVAEQVETLLKLFPNRDASHVGELACGELPKLADGFAVILKPDKIGTYHEALAKAIRLLSKDRQFKNWREGALTERHLRLTEKTLQAHAMLNKQPGDFWVFPFQFGKRWAGHSIRNAQIRLLESEFGLGPYEGAILLLTHPDRITGSEQLYIDCAGCEYSLGADGDFGACLSFYWYSRYELLALDCS